MGSRTTILDCRKQLSKRGKIFDCLLNEVANMPRSKKKAVEPVVEPVAEEAAEETKEEEF